MDVEECIDRFGLQPDQQHLAAIRSILKEQIDAERQQQGLGDTELIKLCCIQLFSVGDVSDIELIWHAKTSSMDADASVDVQLLCGAGLGPSKAYLQSINQPWAEDALGRVVECERAGDFGDFDPATQMSFYRDFFSPE
jgi:hypothetical protein